MTKIYYLLIFSFFTSFFDISAQPTVLKDINHGIADACIDSFSILTIGSKTFFTANDGVHGNELWITDGTSNGTTLLKDIYPGSLSSNPTNFMALNNILIFFAKDNNNGVQLWKSDGTPEGTVFLKYISTYGADYSSVLPKPYITFNDQLYFTASYNSSPFDGVSLWKTNGTASGTQLLYSPSLQGNIPTNMIIFKNQLYIHYSRTGIYRLNSAGNGISLFKPFNTVIGWAILGTELIIGADDGGGLGAEIWKTDGTTTTFVKDIDTRSGYSGLGTTTINTFEQPFVTYKGFVYFAANNGTTGDELFRTDGTANGTTLFKEFTQGTDGYAPQNFRVVNNFLYFKCKNVNNNIVLFRTDGTTGGINEIKQNLYPNYPLSFTLPTEFYVHGGKLYMNASVFFGKDLWVTNPTSLFAQRLAQSNTEYGLQPYDFASLGNLLLFRGQSATLGWELWSYADPNIIPVELINFEAKSLGEQNLLTWSTAQEINNNGFDIQSSENIKEWHSIGFLAGNNGSSPQTYKFIDNIPSKISYYRLRHIDIDGKESYSKIISIIKNDDKEITLFPNPTDGKIYLNALNNLIEKVEIYNTYGQIVTELSPKNNLIDISDLPNAVYQFVIFSDKAKIYKRIVKSK